MNESKLDVKVVRSDRQWRDAQFIRERVFIEEQECPPEEEWDDFEDTSRHFVGYLGDSPVAAARWRAAPHANRIVAKLERFAVLKEHRAKRFGRAMVEATMNDAQEAGFSEFLLHAQEHLADFYSSFGFKVCGDIFMEANIRHVPMDLLQEASTAEPR